MNIRKIAIGVSLLGFATISQASTFTFSGNITNNNDVVRVDFNLANIATNVRVWTDSFLSGTNFDPITALWNTNTGARIDQNDDNSRIAPGQTVYDSGFALDSLAAGNYFFTMAVFPNFAKGLNISNGFNFDGQSPVALTTGTFWRINLDGVDTATGPVDPNPSAVPLPGAVWLFGTAIAGFAGFSRRKTV